MNQLCKPTQTRLIGNGVIGMKKIISLFLVAALCCCAALPAMAEEFVPSIGYKDNPTIEGEIELVDKEENVLEKLDSECLEITPVSEAIDTPEDKRSDSDKLLVDVYEKLTDGTMKLPYDETMGDMVIRDLIDASLICGEEHTDPNHVEELAKEDVYIRLTFDLGVKPETEVVVMAYVDGKWEVIETVRNNGDGTVTCVFNQICPIAFSVEADSAEPPHTGDTMGSDLLLWLILLIISFVAVVTMLVYPHRKSAKKK